jgi:hypothetical protein
MFLPGGDSVSATLLRVNFLFCGTSRGASSLKQRLGALPEGTDERSMTNYALGDSVSKSCLSV